MPRRARAYWYRVGVSGHPCWVPPEQRGWLGSYPLLSASRRDERPGRIHCQGREITGTGIPCRWAQRRGPSRGTGSTATSAADHRRVNSSPSPARRRARRRCTAREKPARRLLVNWRHDRCPARLGRDVWRGRSLVGCMSALASAVVRRWNGSGLRLRMPAGDRTQRSNVAPSAQEHANLDAAVSAVRTAVRTAAAGPLHLLSVCGRQQKKTGVGVPGSTMERLVSRTGRAGRRLSG